MKGNVFSLLNWGLTIALPKPIICFTDVKPSLLFLWVKTFCSQRKKQLSRFLSDAVKKFAALFFCPLLLLSILFSLDGIGLLALSFGLLF
jgi:hypothetical protein